MSKRFNIKKEDLPEEVSENETKEDKEETPNSFMGSNLVLYTDGGCRPKSRGYAGFGMHGYFYNPEKPKQGSGCKLTPTPTGYVDMAGVNSVTVLDYVDFWSTIPGESTNNVAEIKAIIEAMTLAVETKVKKLHILSDSQNSIDTINKKWIYNWEQNGWKKKDRSDVANVEHWIDVLDLLRKLEELGCDVTIGKVSAHSGELGNDLADDHATRGVLLSLDGITKRHMHMSPARGYWSPKVDVNRFLGKSCWYFATNMEKESHLSDDGRHVYMLGHHGPEDRFLGKRASDHSYSVVYLKQPDLVLDAIRNQQSKLTNGSSIVIGRLDAIRQPSRYHDFELHGTQYLHVDSKSANIDMQTPTSVQITKEMKPARLALRAIEILETLDDMLARFIAGCDKLTVTEITDTFYEIEETKRSTKTVFSKNIKQSNKHIDIDVAIPFEGEPDENVRLLFDMDLPSRNVMSALASKSPKVYVLTWAESDHGYRVATIVETEDDIGIWSTVHSNIKLKKSSRK